MDKFRDELGNNFVWTDRTLPTDVVEPEPPKPQPTPEPVTPVVPTPPKPVEPEPEPVVEPELVTAEPEEESSDAGLIVGLFFLILFLVLLTVTFVYCYKKDKEFYKKMGPWFRENCTKDKYRACCSKTGKRMKLCWAMICKQDKNTHDNTIQPGYELDVPNAVAIKARSQNRNNFVDNEVINSKQNN